MTGWPADLGPHPGWKGHFTRQEVLGMWKPGTPIVKADSEPGDTNPDGTRGIVLGCLHHPQVGGGYFVEWETSPRHAVFVTARRVRADV